MSALGFLQAMQTAGQGIGQGAANLNEQEQRRLARQQMAGQGEIASMQDATARESIASQERLGEMQQQGFREKREHERDMFDISEKRAGEEHKDRVAQAEADRVLQERSMQFAEEQAEQARRDHAREQQMRARQAAALARGQAPTDEEKKQLQEIVDRRRQLERKAAASQMLSQWENLVRENALGTVDTELADMTTQHQERLGGMQDRVRGSLQDRFDAEAFGKTARQARRQEGRARSRWTKEVDLEQSTQDLTLSAALDGLVINGRTLGEEDIQAAGEFIRTEGTQAVGHLNSLKQRFGEEGAAELMHTLGAVLGETVGNDPAQLGDMLGISSEDAREVRAMMRSMHNRIEEAFDKEWISREAIEQTPEMEAREVLHQLVDAKIRMDPEEADRLRESLGAESYNRLMKEVKKTIETNRKEFEAALPERKDGLFSTAEELREALGGMTPAEAQTYAREQLEETSRREAQVKDEQEQRRQAALAEAAESEEAFWDEFLEGESSVPEFLARPEGA